MTIAILGTGSVGKALANGFVSLGHTVRIGSRSGTKLTQWISEKAPNVTEMTFKKIGDGADMFVLAVKGAHAEEVLHQVGKKNLKGKLVIDTTNPIDDDIPPKDGVLSYFTDINYSLMEILQAEFKEAEFVKAFSCVGAPLMVRPNMEGGRPTMFIAGNSDKAKKTVVDILNSFGWDVNDMGTVVGARAIEPLAMLWCIPGFRSNRWNHAMKMLSASIT